MNKAKLQKGFALVESLIIVLVVAVVGFGGYTVWHKHHDKIVNSYAACVSAGGAIQQSYAQRCVIHGKSFVDPNQKAPTPPKSATNPSGSTSSSQSSTPKDINYSPAVEIKAASDTTKLAGASLEFKTFVASEFSSFYKDGAACGSPDISINSIVRDQFSVGEASSCTTDNLLWVKVDSKWQRVSENEGSFECKTVNTYKIPASLVEKCNSGSGLVNNTNS